MSVVGGGKVDDSVIVIVYVDDVVIVVVILVIVAPVDNIDDVNVDVDDVDVLLLAIVSQTKDIDPGCITALSFSLDCPELILGFEELLDRTIGL